MSDFSLLFKKYNSISNLTNELNNSVITLKRKNLVSESNVQEQYPNLYVSEEDVDKAKLEIFNILTSLQDFYQNQDIENTLYGLKDNISFKNQILNDAGFKGKVHEALEKIKADKNLGNSELFNIDKFISVLDNESSILYKKLRTNRG